MSIDHNLPRGLDDLYGVGASEADLAHVPTAGTFWIHESSDCSWHVDSVLVIGADNGDDTVTATNCAYNEMKWHGTMSDFLSEFEPDDRPMCSEVHGTTQEDDHSVAETSGIDTGFQLDARL
jgi:hypothetical protein